MTHLYKVVIKNSAKKDLKKLKQSNLKDQFNNVIEVLRKNPFEASQSFEKLVPRKHQYYSRRLNHQHRVVYKVNQEENIVEIYSAWSHYE